MRLSKFKILNLMILSMLLIVSCSGGGGGDGSGTDTGTVSLSLMDLPNGEYKAVYINISEVQVHKAGAADKDGKENNGSWSTVGTPNKIYNLLELVNGVMESLGTKELEAGKYTQVRLIIGEDVPLDQEGNPAKNINDQEHPESNYVIDQADNVLPLKIPSGFNTGIKLVHNFNVTKNGLMELILDFDALNSIVRTGNGKLILKPTIKIIEAVNYAEVSGKVRHDSVNLGGIRVSAQTYKTDSGVIAEHAATYTDSADVLGYYRLPLEPGHTYNVVTFSKDYAPECVSLAAENGKDYTQNFKLIQTDNHHVSLDIIFTNSNLDPLPDVTVSFIYLDADCGAGAQTDQIQVGSVVAVYDNLQYEYNDIYLPYGSYKLVASAEGYPDFETVSPFSVGLGMPADPIEIIFEK